VRVLALAAYRIKLREVKPFSLLGRVDECSVAGFEPNTPLGHAYLIPFDVFKYESREAPACEEPH